MQQKLQRYQAFIRSGRTGQLGGELFDLVDYAICRRSGGRWCTAWQDRMAKAGGVDVRLRDLDVDEVPLTRCKEMLLDGVPVRIAKPVGPRGFTDKVVGRQPIAVARQHCKNFLTYRRLKIMAGNLPHNFVPFVTP